MQVNIKFHTNNDAFHKDDYAEFERILTDLSMICYHDGSGSIRDINGNTVGRWSWQNS